MYHSQSNNVFCAFPWRVMGMVVICMLNKKKRLFAFVVVAVLFCLFVSLLVCFCCCFCLFFYLFIFFVKQLCD